MKNGAFAPKEQRHNFPYFLKIRDISKASKGVIMERRILKFIMFNEGLPLSPSCGVYSSQIIRFAGLCSNVIESDNRTNL